MSQHLLRGKLLIAQNRVDAAEKEFRQALQMNPDDGIAMAWLAECHLHKSEYAEALQLAERAMAYTPNNGFLLYVLARSYFYNKRIREAEEVIDRAIALNPEDADFYLLRAHIAFYREQWKPALQATERGLEIEPENVSLINMRAQALVKLNRKEDAAETIDFALHHSPEDSYSHANKGWVAIEQNNFDAAFTHFREALRLDPDNSYARSGLREAIKAKNLLYRGMLKYFLWMAKMNSRNRWAFIIGAYILYRIVLEAAERIPSLAPLLYPVIAFYILFALSSWIAMPLSNLFLRLHPLGRHALEEDEITATNVTGLVMLAGLICGIAYLVSGSEMWMLLALFFLLMLVPVGGTFTVDADGKARRSLIYYSLALTVVALLGIFIPSLGWMLFLFFIGIFAFSWVANYLIGQDAKEFG
jgi:tetratricopeptide (TPR) repeat protein